jgi:hypothetical protein
MYWPQQPCPYADVDAPAEALAEEGSLALKAMGVECGCACRRTGGATQLLWICVPMYWPQHTRPYADVDQPANEPAAQNSSYEL